jgi:hypothetical protein
MTNKLLINKKIGIFYLYLLIINSIKLTNEKYYTHFYQITNN